MGNQEGGAVFKEVADRVLDQLFGLGVDRTGRLIQHEDGGVGQHRPGEGDQLFLAGREAVAPFADVGIPAVFQLFDDGIGRDRSGRRLDFLIGRVEAAVADVLHDGAGEEVGALEDVAEGGVEPELAALPVVFAVDQDLPRGRLEEPAGEVDKGRLARPRLADDRDGRAGGDVEVEVLEDVFAAVRVLEGDVLKLDFAFDRLPVFLFRLEGGAVFGDDFGGVLDHRLFIQQVHDPLDVRLGGNQFRDVGGEVLDRLEDADRVGRKGRQGPERHQAAQHHMPALV